MLTLEETFHDGERSETYKQDTDLWSSSWVVSHRHVGLKQGMKGWMEDMTSRVTFLPKFRQKIFYLNVLHIVQ